MSCWAALALAACLAAAALAPARAALKYDGNTDAYGGTLLTPTKGTIDGRNYYFEIPHDPVGVLFMAHGCVHDAADFWPASSACPECSGAACGAPNDGCWGRAVCAAGGP